MQLTLDNRTRAGSGSAAHHGGAIEVIVLGAYAAELALLIGNRGSVAAILLASLAAGFWWLGYGRTDDLSDPVAIGNALGIMLGLVIGFPQLLLPLIVAIPAIAFTTCRRILRSGTVRQFGILAVSTGIATVGATWLALNLHLLPV
jgi:hypothetical protein